MENKGKVALITGITGQDGGYLSEFLLKKGYEVYGMYRRSSLDNQFGKVEHLRDRINLVCGEMTDMGSLAKIIKEIKPEEIYNLAAQSQVRVSFDQEFYTHEVNWLGVERLLDCIREYSPNAKLYQASTSELFGEVSETPQSEKTPFNPASPYALSKLKAHNAVKREREKGLFCCSGILFNHESPRRGLEFVTRKFTDGIVRLKLGISQRETGKDYLEMGNLEAKRDWGHARDYVGAMWMMLQQNKPKDYVVSTGETHSVREFIETAAKEVGIEITWKGEGKYETGYDKNGKKIIAINPKFFRPVEVNMLRGDSSEARKELGWSPKIRFNELVKEMVESDLKNLQK
jgi:GDPmannose 4,6-dehydratase